MMRWLRPGRLFIGLSISHFGTETTVKARGSSQQRPSVIGFAANIGSADIEFMGDFGFHDPGRTDMTALVAKFVSRAVERYSDAKLQYPSQIVDYEVPLIRHALEKSRCGKTPLTLIVVNRAHHIRLIPREVRHF
ncbi:unnamed protein product [Gongylonema pulchrum]|uniref:Piwi domain-containing protein n=1 Tax=Gongylonema pulchrum TaxID=637853 RepID=A0A183EVI4_9BILA|nr:unnamed protein product [Gongylonema pulchrum]